MATQTLVTMVDDITGEPGDDVTSRAFGFDGRQYEIDLSDASFKTFSELAQPYVDAARKVTGSVPPRAPGKPSGKPRGGADAEARARTLAARTWARSQGLQVKDRGRMPAEMMAQWEAAGSPMPAE